MTAGPWTFTNAALTSILDGTFAIGTDTFKVALHTSSGTQPGASTTTWAGLSTSEVGTTNTGYTAGGEAVTLTLTGTTVKTVDFDTDPVWTAGSAGLTARWAVIYEVGGNVLCYSLLDDAPADVSVSDGNTLTVAANASGLFTLSVAA